MATPSGERSIAALKVGNHVTAYDPATGKQTTQTVERVFINHDTDRLDVTLAVAQPARAPSAQHAGRARPATAGTSSQEVIHTTASHPWLSADHGWLRAGQLHLGEPVRLLDGATATVVGLHALPGVGAMWDLSLDATHTFAVGNMQVVVHNCPIGGDGSQNPVSNDWLSQGATQGSANDLATTPDGRVYSWHYLTETGPIRNIPGSVVDETIDNATYIQDLGDRTVYYDAKNDVTVVQSGTTGKIMSVHRGAP